MITRTSRDTIREPRRIDASQMTLSRPLVHAVETDFATNVC